MNVESCAEEHLGKFDLPDSGNSKGPVRADTVESVPQAHKLVVQEVLLYLCISSLEDGGRSTGVCCRKLASNCLKLLVLRVLVVSVEEKVVKQTIKYGTERRVQPNPC